MNQKLVNSLAELVSNDIITDSTAQEIRDFYEPESLRSQNRLYTIFGVIGSTLVGLGIILIIAHNWEHLSRLSKSIIAFLPLLIGQIVSGYCILKKKNMTWSESVATFNFFALGACLSLVSQIYNIQGDLHSFLLNWILLSSPIIYLFKSKALAVLYILFTTAYACSYGYFFFSEYNSPWMYLFLLLIFIPMYIYLYKKNPRDKTIKIFNWLIPLSLTIVLGTFVEYSSFGFLMYIALFGCFYNLGRSRIYKDLRTRQNGFLVIGSSGIKVILLVASFNWFWREFDYLPLSLSQDIIITGVLIFINICLIAIRFNVEKNWKVDFIATVPFIFLLTYFLSHLGALVSTIFINVLILVIGLLIIKKAIENLNILKMNYGLLLISILIICRFFDNDISFVNRGLIFVLVGIGFFFSNYVLIKRKNNKLKNIS